MSRIILQEWKRRQKPRKQILTEINTSREQFGYDVNLIPPINPCILLFQSPGLNHVCLLCFRKISTKAPASNPLHSKVGMKTNKTKCHHIFSHYFTEAETSTKTSKKYKNRPRVIRSGDSGSQLDLFLPFATQYQSSHRHQMTPLA